MRNDKRRLLRVLVICTTAVGCARDTTSPDIARVPSQIALDAVAERAISVMSYNIYQGTELENSIAATTPEEFVAGATMDFLTMHQTNFSERASAIAAVIAETRPDIIGLQEVALWRTGPHTTPAQPATNVDQDFLGLLLSALSSRGVSYSIAASVDNFDVQGPAMLSAGVLTDVRLTDRDVILARAGESSTELTISNKQSRNYTTNLVLPTVGGNVTVLEGWASIDVKSKGRTFRFITTHLDANVPQIRLAQATELLTGPANTDLPVVVAGDMNTDPTTDTYAAFTSAGFVDAWAQQRPLDTGYTCCEVLPTINNATPTLSQRIDLVLTRGSIEVASLLRVGAEASTRTASGLWPSDHAGLVARVAPGIRR